MEHRPGGGLSLSAHCPPLSPPAAHRLARRQRPQRLLLDSRLLQGPAHAHLLRQRLQPVRGLLALLLLLCRARVGLEAAGGGLGWGGGRLRVRHGLGGHARPWGAEVATTNSELCAAAAGSQHPSLLRSGAHPPSCSLASCCRAARCAARVAAAASRSRFLFATLVIVRMQSLKLQEAELRGREQQLQVARRQQVGCKTAMKHGCPAWNYRHALSNALVACPSMLTPAQLSAKHPGPQWLMALCRPRQRQAPPQRQRRWSRRRRQR